MTAGRRKILRCAQDDRGKAPKMTEGKALRMTMGDVLRMIQKEALKMTSSTFLSS